jgi:integrase
MARPRKTEPRYLEHKQSGRGRAVWYDANGEYNDRLLPGPFRSKESLGAFGRILLEQEVSPKAAAVPVGKRATLSLVEVLDAYLTHAERHYRNPEGQPTSELREHKLVLRALRELYGDKTAAEFGPLALKAVRQGWVVAGLSRGEANRRTNIARRIFRWAVAEELVDGAVLTALDAVAGLQRGRTVARETEPVGPVDDAVVDATLPHLNRFVVGMVEFQRLTGCRPGEACVLRRCDIDTGGRVWLYSPKQHKTAHKGKTRTIAIGPKAQKVLREFLTPDLDAYLFPPSVAVAELHAERTGGRTTPRYPSHMRRNRTKRARNPRRAPTEHYTCESYGHAIARACDRAFPPPRPLAQQEDETRAEWQARLTPAQREKLKEWQKEHRWQPNQLRHSFATRVRKAHGLEAAQVLLGHEKMDTSQIYAEKNTALAVQVAAEIG